jgi:hypothetical protein
MLYYTSCFVSLSRRGWCDLCHLRAHLLLLWGLGSTLGGRLGLLRAGLLLGLGLGLLHVVRVDVLLDVQEGHLDALGHLQQVLQGIVQRDVLTRLQTLGLDILVHTASHLRTRNLLTGRQAQEGPQLVGNVQGLVETVILGTGLLLLTGRVLDVLADLANVLAQSTLLLGDGLNCDGQRVESSHMYYLYHGSL